MTYYDENSFPVAGNFWLEILRQSLEKERAKILRQQQDSRAAKAALEEETLP